MLSHGLSESPATGALPATTPARWCESAEIADVAFSPAVARFVSIEGLV